MARTLVSNIGLLVTNDPTQDGTPLGIIKEAALVIDNGSISWVGPNNQATKSDFEYSVDANSKCVIPGFVDSHSHIIFAGDRSEEFRSRMQGEPYSAGGIKSTVALTRSATNQDLLSNAHRILAEANSTGTTTLEIKSGYGLTIKDETRSLEIASSLTEETTFLGAHVVPTEFQNDPEGYVELICGEMLDKVKPYAKWIDVFCDKGAFTPDQTRKILKAGIAKGLKPRLHANQLEAGDGIKIGVELDAASVDHVSHISEHDISLLSNSNTVATILPGAEFSTRSKYLDARVLFAADINIALASDCNPGSSYTSNMQFIIALAVREFFFSPEQALWSATKGGAMALRRNDIGHLSVGTSADFSILKTSSYIHLAYRPGVQLIEEVWRRGNRI